MKNSGMKKINILITAIVLCISVVAVSLVYIPRLAGYATYSIETGSMEPTIKTGSLIYVKKCKNFEDYAVGDIVTFSDRDKVKSFTHRIIKINYITQSFDTQGDANNAADIEPTSADYAVGKVEFVIPFAGYAVTFLRNTVVRIIVAVIYIAWLAIEIEIIIAERKKKYE